MKDNKTIGALWKHKAQSGRTFLSGTIELGGEKHSILVFTNSFKDAENQPDYRILLAQPREQQQGQPQQAPAADDFLDGAPEWMGEQLLHLRRGDRAITTSGGAQEV